MDAGSGQVVVNSLQALVLAITAGILNSIRRKL